MTEDSLEVVVARIDERTENLEKNLKSFNTAIQKVIDDHETRIRKVETNFIKVLGVGALIGFITGWIGRFFGGNP